MTINSAARVAITSCFIAGILTGATINYPSFPNMNGLVVNTRHTYPEPRIVDNKLRLTSSLNTGTTTSVWYQNQVNVNDGFQTSFDYRITLPSGDGFAFVIQGDPAGDQAIGLGAGGLGYTYITHGLAVDFDVYTSGRTNIKSCGVYDLLSSQYGGCTQGSVTNPGLFDEQLHTATIKWNPVYQKLTVTTDLGYGSEVYLPDSLTNWLGLNNGRAYVGFTAATGGATQTVDISRWTLTTAADLPEPGTWWLLGSAFGAMAFLHLRNRRWAILKP